MEKDCTWCLQADGRRVAAKVTVVDECEDTVAVCLDCSRSYHEWLREQDRVVASEGFEGPYYADTMSGGCIYLGG
jgi:hypothetical protein